MNWADRAMGLILGLGFISFAVMFWCFRRPDLPTWQMILINAVVVILAPTGAIMIIGSIV